MLTRALADMGWPTAPQHRSMSEGELHVVYSGISPAADVDDLITTDEGAFVSGDQVVRIGQVDPTVQYLQLCRGGTQICKGHPASQTAMLCTYLWGQALRHSMHSTQLRLSTSCSTGGGRGE